MAFIRQMRPSQRLPYTALCGCESHLNGLHADVLSTFFCRAFFFRWLRKLLKYWADVAGFPLCVTIRTRTKKKTRDDFVVLFSRFPPQNTLIAGYGQAFPPIRRQRNFFVLAVLPTRGTLRLALGFFHSSRPRMTERNKH